MKKIEQLVDEFADAFYRMVEIPGINAASMQAAKEYHQARAALLAAIPDWTPTYGKMPDLPREDEDGSIWYWITAVAENGKRFTDRAKISVLGFEDVPIGWQGMGCNYRPEEVVAYSSLPEPWKEDRE